MTRNCGHGNHCVCDLAAQPLRVSCFCLSHFVLRFLTPCQLHLQHKFVTIKSIVFNRFTRAEKTISIIINVSIIHTFPPVLLRFDSPLMSPGGDGGGYLLIALQKLVVKSDGSGDALLPLE